jgi:hypothetical protein
LQSGGASSSHSPFYEKWLLFTDKGAERLRMEMFTKGSKTSSPRVDTADSNPRPAVKRFEQECFPVSSRNAMDRRHRDKTRNGPIIVLFMEPSAMPALLSKVTESGSPKDSSNTSGKIE